MNPEGRLAAVALEDQDQRHDDVADRENGEVRRGVVGAVWLQGQLAGRAVAAHLEEAREQAAGPAARAAAAPAAQQAGPKVWSAFPVHGAQDGALFYRRPRDRLS